MPPAPIVPTAPTLALNDAAPVADTAGVVDPRSAVSAEDFATFCEASRKILISGDRSRECVSVLRELHAQLQVNPRDHRLPRPLVDLLFAIASEPQQGPPRLRLLCVAALACYCPTTHLRIRSFEAPIDRRQIPLLLPLLLAQGRDALRSHTSTAKQWVAGVQAEDDVRAMALTVVSCMSRYHDGVLAPVHAQALNASLAGILRHASTVSAETSQRQKQQGAAALGLYAPVGRQGPPLLELDGTVSRECFTVLSVARHYGPDQVLSMNVFSMMAAWLRDNFVPTLPRNPPSRAAEVTPAPSSALASEGGERPPGDSANPAANSDPTGPPKLERDEPALSASFKEDLADYCLRVIDQTLAAAHLNVQGSGDAGISALDARHMQAAAVESVTSLDLLCRADSAAGAHARVPQVVPALKRLVAARGAEQRPHLLLAIMRFFLRHGDVVAVDREPLYKSFFGGILATGHRDQALAMDTLLFCREHAAQLSGSGAFRLYFPNLFKILAWSPRTFLTEFLELGACFCGPVLPGGATAGAATGEATTVADPT